MNRFTGLLLGTALIAGCCAGVSAGSDPSAELEHPAEGLRVVSMNPSLTRMLIAFGAQQVLVGVDEYSADHEPAVATLPRVGGLFNPSLEAVVALEPDLVIVVPSVQQRDFRSRLRELGVEVIELASITLDQILESMQTLGDQIGRSQAARERVAAIRSTWIDVAREASHRPRRSAVRVEYDARRAPAENQVGVPDELGERDGQTKLPEIYGRVSRGPLRHHGWQDPRASCSRTSLHAVEQ